MSEPIENDFGRYLVSVGERDIDLLLMEEFHVDADFVSWFCSLLGISNVQFAGAWHSVSDTDGETDLLLRVTLDGRRVGILIENKIAAPEQNEQAERYHLRGIRSREAGKFDEYVTVICAPQRYLDGLAADSAYQHRVPYEAMADWYAKLKGRRAEWRHHVIWEAIDQGRRGYTMSVNAVNTAFHRNYWEHLRQNHPRIHMTEPEHKGPFSYWVLMKGHDFPKGVRFHHKLDQQVMELGFDGRRVEEIMERGPEFPNGVKIVQKGKTASLQMNVPPIDMTAGVASQLEAIEDALKAAYLLMPYATLFVSGKR